MSFLIVSIIPLINGMYCLPFKCAVGLPLTSLDLTDYVNISDKALRTVGRLKK